MKQLKQLIYIIFIFSGITLFTGCIKIMGSVNKEYHANGQLNEIRWETEKSKGNTHYDNYLLKVYYRDGVLKVRKRFRGTIVNQTGYPVQAKTKVYDEDGDLLHVTIYRNGKLVKKQ